MGHVLLLLTGLCGAASGGSSYIERTIGALEACRVDLPAMAETAEGCAARLVEGGRLWVAGQASMVSELSGRAGGMMMMKALGDATPGPKDVVLLAAEAGAAAPAPWPAETLVVGIGACGENEGMAYFDAHAEALGLVPSFANVMPGWVFTAELVGALTRRGKMPVMYETIGLYGGFARIQQYQDGAVPYHEDRQVMPAAPGALGTQFIEKVTAMLRRVRQEEAEDIAKAARWAREAKGTGKTAYLYSMGHLYPAEVDNTVLGQYFKSGVWYPMFRNMPVPDDQFQGGDFVLHLGYQHSPDTLLKRAHDAHARAAYIDLHRNRDFADPETVVWIDPMWDWPDGCVTIEGYDVPFIPASGVVNTAIAWEIHRQAQP